MTAKENIQQKLEELRKPSGKTYDTDLEETIFKLVMSKKFRKYSCNDELQKHIKVAIQLGVKNNAPIKFTFVQGAYKLWRLEESPEADWAELFSAMHYTNWLKPICEVHKPGVWFDYFVDDLILPKLHTSSLEDSKMYRESFQSVLDFLGNYCPPNFKATITGVGDQFKSEQEFEEKLAKDIKRHANTLPGGLPEIDEERKAMIELNVEQTPELTKDPKWREKNALIHDAYIGLTKRETNYHWQPDKIKVFTQPLPSGTVIAVGSTKDSVTKSWVGVGALKPRDGSYRQIILSPNQLEDSKFSFENIEIEGLSGKNFHKIRVLKG